MKSIENRFNEALAALDESKKRKQFDEQVRPEMPLETRLHLAEKILGKEISKKFQESTTIEIRESRKKHNGAIDNGHGPITEVAPILGKKDIFSQGDAVLVESMRERGIFTEAEASKLRGEQPAEYNNLSEVQKKEFDFCRLIGISESDSLIVARMAGDARRPGRNL